jgi:uncharacterized membrane protein (UPF0127 family)
MCKITSHILSISITALLLVGVLSCKDSNASKTSESLVISFKKEGMLQIKKAVTDTLIQSLDIEIADDDYQIQTGLMYRNEMADHQGMLFLFPKAAERSFYMKNTRIPLDIIYLGADSTIVSVKKNAKPFDETSLPSNAPSKYVLEVNAGLFDAWKLEVGDRVNFEVFE